MRALTLIVASALFLAVPARADELASDRPVETRLTPQAAPAPAVALTDAPVPVVKRWYFWVGVGAVVTGIVVASIALSVQASKPPALTESAVCGANGGHCDACVNFAACTAK